MFAVAVAVILTSTSLLQVPDWATRCRIDSAYESAGGEIINALVDINGNEGTYTLYEHGVQATLRNIQFVRSMGHPQGPNTSAIVGSWHFGNNSGYFVFRKPAGNGIVDGYWGFGNQPGRGRIYSWDGIIQVVAQNQPPRPAKQVPAKPDFGNDLLPQFKGLPEAFVGEKGLNVPDDWFPKGATLGQSVGQLVTNDGTGWGVCFMIGDGIAVTVKHVLDDIGEQPAQVRFQIPGTATYYSFTMARKPMVLGRADIAIICLNKDEKFAWPPPLKLPLVSDLKLNDMPARKFNAKNAQIIHFPKNQGRRTNIHGRFLDPPLEGGYRYTTETEPGSSGAPVFDFDWNLVAIHWGAQTRADGKTPEFNLGYKIEHVLVLAKRHLGQTEQGMQVLKSMGL